ncbi:MAG TPA: hypothetical protein VGV38_04565, partial [Pyrinomonadaceae bacterium]|nr:hypothetical protein [Pyrinomonadaceae bacterium]
VELPPAEIDESAVLLNFDSYRPHVPELLEALRAGTVAEPVPVMLDGSTFVVHGATRSFWVKLWHATPEMTRVLRAQVISCLPSTRGVQVYVAGLDDEEDFDEDEFEGDDYDEDDDDEDDASPDAFEDDGVDSAGGGREDDGAPRR